MSKPKIDYLFLFSVLALSAIGLVMVFSASPTLGLKVGDGFYFVKRHILYLLLGASAFFLGQRIDLKDLRKFAPHLLAAAFALLLLVYLPGVGVKVKGAARWIDLYLITFQPSELAKFSLILYFAAALANKKEKIQNFFSGLLPLLALLGITIGLVVKQPDLGTALVISGACFILLFIAGAKNSHLLGLGGIGLLGVIILSVTSPYRIRRLLAYIDPWKDPLNVGFQIIQSLLAIGSGGLLGLGLGASRQKFFYLPQQFTDFIFAILCEELGFLGGATVVFLFALLTYRGYRLALASSDGFTQLLKAGLISWISLQAAINLLVVTSIIPTTGIPLPFISYGGTATIINLFAMGIVLNPSERK